MPIDPVTFTATTIAAVAANKHEKSEIERKTKALNDNLRIATQNQANFVNRELLDFYGEDESRSALKHANGIFLEKLKEAFLTFE